MIRETLSLSSGILKVEDNVGERKKLGSGVLDKQQRRCRLQGRAVHYKHVPRGVGGEMNQNNKGGD